MRRVYVEPLSVTGLTVTVTHSDAAGVVHDDHHEIICTGPMPPTRSAPPNTDDKDALIAEMLVALKDMLTRFERCAAHVGSDSEFIQQATASARAAIAKAEGR